MTLNIKMIGMWLFAACMLILFAGCDGKDEGTDRESRAMLVAETVNYSTTTNSITTEGARGVTFRAVISAEEDAAWCSFALTEPLTETGGEAGSPVFIYLQKNGTDEDRTARIDMTFSDGYAVRLEMTQRSAGSTIVYDYERSWAEQPVLREDADFIYKTYYTTLATTEYATGGYRRNYSICYDRAKHVSRWVAYPVHYCYTTPSFERTNDWAFDPNDQLPEIPREDQQYILKGYGSYGYDRGHMLASATRYNTRATNAMTFYATNMMPQSSRFNQGIWATLEGKERDWGPEREKTGGKYLNYDTLYVVTGTEFLTDKTIDNRNGPIAVPSHCWKVMLRQRGNENRPIWDFSADELKAVGFLFTNDSDGAATSLREAACTVEEIEKLTGFTFFRNLDPDVAREVKGSYDPGDWPGL